MSISLYFRYGAVITVIYKLRLEFMGITVSEANELFVFSYEELKFGVEEKSTSTVTILSTFIIDEKYS